MYDRVKWSQILEYSTVHVNCCMSVPIIMSGRQVESLVLVPGRGQQCPLAALTAGETVYLLDPREEEPRTLHSVYGHPVSCLDASDSHVAFGVKRTGWAMYDGGNKVGSVSLQFLSNISIKLRVGPSAHVLLSCAFVYYNTVQEYLQEVSSISNTNTNTLGLKTSPTITTNNLDFKQLSCTVTQGHFKSNSNKP